MVLNGGCQQVGSNRGRRFEAANQLIYLHALFLLEKERAEAALMLPFLRIHRRL